MCKLTLPEKTSLDPALTKADFNLVSAAMKLCYFVRGEKPFFQQEIDPPSIVGPICALPKLSNERITAQSGAFFAFGKADRLDPVTPPAWLRIETMKIKASEKAKILRELAVLNISAKTVYPALEQTAKHLRAKYS